MDRLEPLRIVVHCAELPGCTFQDGSSSGAPRRDPEGAHGIDQVRAQDLPLTSDSREVP
jgi:hypothetical protein